MLAYIFTLYKALGDVLNGSGCTNTLALVQSKLTTSGTADSFLRVTYIKRTWRVHQVASALYWLQQQAYSQYVDSIRDGNKLPLSSG